MDEWIRIRWNANAKGYSYTKSLNLHRDPQWSSKSIDELLEIALDGKLIDSLEHPEVQKLLDPKDSLYE